ncbi:YggS family pyridoxal phosphate-dependent enzyme [Bacillus sp. CGMCC 1.16541]|uniref:YggS family pyridoxal phosphate-dependent enzyme n=1 Tax=Bacillus sp. CGMCC 1.16541 TaxID=2185143 RepID=UPI000D72F840|nr:YggS family pyridoxal phosphate-dependent enzyme [Bacillus sp. CGMCC 1.16541]
MATVLHNLEHIKREIDESCDLAKRNPNEIRIIAVTKYVSTNRAQEAVEAGITHLGENRDEEMIEKQGSIQGDVSWHFIGTLQTRKVKNIIERVDYIHSLDRISLAKEIDKRAQKKIKCFVQVNVSQEESKHGISEEEVMPFIEELQSFANIEVIGLMTMAPHVEDDHTIRHCFKALRKLQQRVQALSLSYAPCTELSMGMSNDYQIAIEEGATFIRLGTILVGNEK